MNAKYRIEVERNPVSDLWEPFVRFEGEVVTRDTPAFEFEIDAEKWAERWATDHAKAQASRKSYDFFPQL